MQGVHVLHSCRPCEGPNHKITQLREKKARVRPKMKAAKNIYMYLVLILYTGCIAEVWIALSSLLVCDQGLEEKTKKEDSMIRKMAHFCVLAMEQVKWRLVF